MQLKSAEAMQQHCLPDIKRRQTNTRQIQFYPVEETLQFAVMIIPFDPNKTVLLLLDLQVGFLQRLPPDSSISVVNNAASAFVVARQHGAQLAWLRTALSASDVTVIPSHSLGFAATKESKEMSAVMHPDAASTQIHPGSRPMTKTWSIGKCDLARIMRWPSKAMLGDFAGLKI
jgi:nicotinamidase-related amidase